MRKILILIMCIFFTSCSFNIPFFQTQTLSSKKLIQKNGIEKNLLISSNIDKKHDKKDTLSLSNDKIKEVTQIVYKKPQVKEEKIEPKEEIKEEVKEVVKTTTSKEPKITKLSNFRFKKIAFVGDSHIASDYIPQYFRKTIGIYSLGFIPPVLPKWHNQSLVSYYVKGAKTEYLINTKNNLSFGGINANCFNVCNMQINLDFIANDLFYIEFKDNKWDIKKYANNIQNINLNVQNSKIGGFITNNEIYIDNLGINGASIYNYQRINEDLERQVANILDYDLVIFSFGTNESVADSVNEEKFMQNYKSIINSFRGINTKIILMIPPEPVVYKDRQYKKGPSNEIVNKLIFKLANEQGYFVFDTNALMQNEGGKQAWIEQGKSLKNAHLSKKGYDYVAIKLLDFIKNIK